MHYTEKYLLDKIARLETLLAQYGYDEIERDSFRDWTGED